MNLEPQTSTNFIESSLSFVGTRLHHYSTTLYPFLPAWSSGSALNEFFICACDFVDCFCSIFNLPDLHSHRTYLNFLSLTAYHLISLHLYQRYLPSAGLAASVLLLSSLKRHIDCIQQSISTSPSLFAVVAHKPLFTILLPSTTMASDNLRHAYIHKKARIKLGGLGLLKRETDEWCLVSRELFHPYSRPTNPPGACETFTSWSLLPNELKMKIIEFCSDSTFHSLSRLGLPALATDMLTYSRPNNKNGQEPSTHDSETERVKICSSSSVQRQHRYPEIPRVH